MLKEVYINNNVLRYELEYKNVKNINLRIRHDGTVYISANKKVSQRLIEKLVVSNSDFIFNTLKNYSKPAIQYFSKTEICEVIHKLCRAVYPYFESRGIKYPEIKFRKMTSRWGSCHSTKGILTFNTNLMFAPPECVEYVVMHEFTHFLQPNHSAKFYEELIKICPDWKTRKKRLNAINIRGENK